MPTTFKFLLLLIGSSTDQAHSGRTDSNGGHMNRKTGQCSGQVNLATTEKDINIVDS